MPQRSADPRCARRRLLQFCRINDKYNYIDVATALMRLRALPLLAALLCPPAFAADWIALEAGPGNHWSKGNDAVFVRYRGAHTVPNYPTLPAFFEWSLGTWTNQHSNSALGLALGSQWFVERFHFDFSGGLAVLAHKTRLTGTHQQFILRYGAGYAFDAFDIGVYQTHYSNFRNVFEWDGYNVGYDFVTLQLSFALE
jgi:hypothetical protein